MSWGYWALGDERWPFPLRWPAQSTMAFAEARKARSSRSHFCERGRRAGAGERRGLWLHGGRAAVGVSWFMRLFEPCLWNQLVFAGFQDVFIECQEILYRELKWSDGPVLTREMQLPYRSSKTLCSVMDRYGTQNVKVALKIMLEILSLFLVYWYRAKEKKIKTSIAGSFPAKKSGSFCHVYCCYITFFPRSLWYLGLHSVLKLCVRDLVGSCFKVVEEQQG